MIYLDNAATTLCKPPCVIQAVTHAMTAMGNSARGAHSSALAASREVYETRCLLAELFGLKEPERVVFTLNSTMALNIAIKGLLAAGDHVITTAMEHNSVLRPLYEWQEKGVRLTILPCDELGNISYEQLEQSICADTKAVVCTHISNVTGNINDIARIGDICRRHRILFLLDASQSAGIFPINMEEMHIDVVCFTGHKSLFGPQGTGGLCVREGCEIRPLLSGGTGIHSFSRTQPEPMPTRLEAGTLNIHGIAGLRAALQYNREQTPQKMRRHEQELARYFYEALRKEPKLTFYGDCSNPNHAAIVTFNLGTYDSAEVGDELAVRFGIQTRAGIHCAPLIHRTFGTEKQGAVRVSFSYLNTMEEAEEAVQAVRTLIHEA